MDKVTYRICYAGWIFGALLSVLSFIVAIDTKSFSIVAVGFVTLHLICLVGMIKYEKNLKQR